MLCRSSWHAMDSAAIESQPHGLAFVKHAFLDRRSEAKDAFCSYFIYTKLIKVDGPSILTIVSHVLE